MACFCKLMAQNWHKIYLIPTTKMVLLNCTEYQGRVDHKSWLHIDIKTDDIEKEVTRLENLGASVVEQMSK
jgi:hypothetical protein